MFVVPDRKAIVFKSNNIQNILSNIPSAKHISFKDKQIVAVPHKLDESIVLRNLGVPVPSPILHYYEWPGRYKPYVHQRQTAAFLTMNRRCIVLNEIGTGKTMSALWAADYLIKNKAAKKVLIVSPLSTLERVWAEAIFQNFIGRRYVVLHGSAERRRRLLQEDVHFYIINHDGLNVVQKDLVGKFDLLIVDEAAVLRNPQSVRYRAINKIIRESPNMRLWLMTGTPTPNEPTDAWALAKLIGSPTLTQTHGSFRDSVMMKVGQWKWVPKANSAETVSNVLKPSIRFTRDECLDLPSTVFSKRQVSLTKEQKEHWDQMFKQLIAESQKGQITAANEAVKAQKLIQIACGVAYASDGSSIELDCKPRINALIDTIEEVGGKVIVFVPLTGTLHMLVRELRNHYTVGAVNGQVPAHERSVIFQEFQNTPDPKILLAHPATMAHGLTLTAASTIIWYGPITSNEIYTQANGRIERIGKRSSSNVIHIQANKLEEEMYKRLEGKQRLQGVLLSLIQGE